MEETDGTPVPTAKHGSKHRKGFTIPEHHEIINCIEEYFTIDPDSSFHDTAIYSTQTLKH